MNPEEVNALFDEIIARLGEHFDAVQIMVSWNEESTTQSISRGSGNWYARQGMAHEFVNKDMAQENAHQIAARIGMSEEDED